jgi:hypothetical protein
MQTPQTTFRQTTARAAVTSGDPTTGDLASKKQVLTIYEDALKAIQVTLLATQSRLLYSIRPKRTQ